MIPSFSSWRLKTETNDPSEILSFTRPADETEPLTIEKFNDLPFVASIGRCNDQQTNATLHIFDAVSLARQGNTKCAYCRHQFEKIRYYIRDNELSNREEITYKLIEYVPASTVMKRIISFIGTPLNISRKFFHYLILPIVKIANTAFLLLRISMLLASFVTIAISFVVLIVPTILTVTLPAYFFIKYVLKKQQAVEKTAKLIFFLPLVPGIVATLPVLVFAGVCKITEKYRADLYKTLTTLPKNISYDPISAFDSNQLSSIGDPNRILTNLEQMGLVEKPKPEKEEEEEKEEKEEEPAPSSISGTLTTNCKQSMDFSND